MEQKTVTLNIPADVYERVRQKAEAANRSLEVVVAESLNLLYGDFAADDDFIHLLERLPTFADNELWVVVYSRLSDEQVQQMNTLSEKRKVGSVSVQEQGTLDELIELIDRQMLLRSRALRLLKERGQDIEQYARGI